MEQLIKITSEPMRMARFTQNARLINSDNIDMERRKAIARQTSFRNSIGQGTVSVEDIKRINHTFSKKNVSTQISDDSSRQMVSRQSQAAQTIIPSVSSQESPVISSLETAAMESENSPSTVAVSPEPASVPDISVQTNSSYAVQRGSFEMRVAKGDLTYLPPLVMTIITQRPQIHIEYLGDFNYVPPRDGDAGSNINLFT